jgi:glycosyltransferase involved in cell wall biosynthesis
MRIVLIAPEIPDYALEYARILSKRCTVLLILPEKFYSEVRESSACYEVDWRAWPRQRSLSNIQFMRELAKTIKQWKPDAVHCLDGNHLWIWWLFLLVRQLPRVTTLHDVEVHPGDKATQKVPRLVISTVISLSAGILVHGQSLKVKAVEKWRILPSKIFVFPHPPLRRYKELATQLGYSSPRDGLVRVLFFGRLQSYKGLQYLIAAATKVAEKRANVRFLIAGRGDPDDTSLVSRSQIIIRNEFIPDEDAAKLFAEADILVLPYIEASQSGVLLVAMVFGVPVVATDVGEMAQLVRESSMGCLVQPADADALHNAILELLDDPIRRDQIRASIREYYESHMSDESLAGCAIGIYDQVLAGRDEA